MSYLTAKQQWAIAAVVETTNFSELHKPTVNDFEATSEKDPLYIRFASFYDTASRLPFGEQLMRLLPDLRDTYFSKSFTIERLSESQRAINQLLKGESLHSSLRKEINDALRAARRVTLLQIEIQQCFEEYIRLFRRFPYAICIAINRVLFELRDACFEDITETSVFGFIEAADLLIESHWGAEAASLSGGEIHYRITRSRLRNLELSALLFFTEQ